MKERRAIIDRRAPWPLEKLLQTLSHELQEANEEVRTLLETIRWMAQTNHQGNHQDMRGTFLSCPKNTCDAARQQIERHRKRGRT